MQDKASTSEALPAAANNGTNEAPRRAPPPRIGAGGSRRLRAFRKLLRIRKEIRDVPLAPPTATSRLHSTMRLLRHLEHPSPSQHKGPRERRGSLGEFSPLAELFMHILHDMLELGILPRIRFAGRHP